MNESTEKYTRGFQEEHDEYCALYCFMNMCITLCIWTSTPNCSLAGFHICRCMHDDEGDDHGVPSFHFFHGPNIRTYPDSYSGNRLQWKIDFDMFYLCLNEIHKSAMQHTHRCGMVWWAFQRSASTVIPKIAHICRGSIQNSAELSYLTHLTSQTLGYF